MRPASWRTAPGLHRPNRWQRPQRPRQRGAALLLSMLILSLVVALAGGMVWQQTQAVQVEAAERARAQAAWVLNGALDWARLILAEDARSGRQRGREFDSLDEPWATPLAEARLSTFLAADKDNNTEGGPEAFLAGAIVDAQSRYNLRNLFDASGKPLPAEEAALQRLASDAGLPDDTAARIVAVLRQAWPAPRTPAREGEPAPAAADPEAGPADAPIAPVRLADLAWAGIDPGVLARLAPQVDLLPQRTAINANTAPAAVLAAVIGGIDRGTAERLVQQRKRQPFDSIDQLRAALGEGVTLDPERVAVGSRYFEVLGRLRLEERVLEERSLVERRPGERGSDVVVVRRQRQSLDAALP